MKDFPDQTQPLSFKDRVKQVLTKFKNRKEKDEPELELVEPRQETVEQPQTPKQVQVREQPPTISNNGDDKYTVQLENLKKILDVVRGKEDYKKKIEILSNPSIPRTSTRLTKKQILFVTASYWGYKVYPELKAMKDLAEGLCLTQISEKGKGIQETIQLQKAMTHGETVTKETVKEQLAKKVKATKELVA